MRGGGGRGEGDVHKQRECLGRKLRELCRILGFEDRSSACRGDVDRLWVQKRVADGDHNGSNPPSIRLLCLQHVHIMNNRNGLCKQTTIFPVDSSRASFDLFTGQAG